jgi:sugar/nucleoside kinase (ribokinase family)
MMRPSRKESKATTALVIGAVSLDIVEYAAGKRMSARFGGVSHNVARALAALGVIPTFLTPRYTGELSPATASQLVQAGIDWQPLEEAAPLAHFFACVDDDGALDRLRFVDNEAFKPLTAARLEQAVELSRNCEAVVSCTDLTLEALQGIRDATSARGLAFWLVASDAVTVAKAAAIKPLVDVICLNSDELAAVTEGGNDDRSLAEAGRSLVGAEGVAAVTLGEHGALLVDPASSSYWRQQPTTAVVRPSLGSGDVLAGALLANRLEGRAWPEALSRSTVVAEQFVVAGDPMLPAFDRIEAPSANPPPSQAFALR